MSRPGRSNARARPVIPRIATVLLLATVVLPLCVFPGVIFPFNTTRALAFRSLVLVATLLLTWAALHNRARLRDGRDPVLWTLAAYVGILTVAGLLGEDVRASLFGDLRRMWGALHWLHLALFYAALRYLFGEKEWRWFFRASVLVSVAVSLWVLLERLGAGTAVPLMRLDPDRASGTLGNPGYLAVYSVVNLLFVVLLWRQETERAWRGVYLSAAVFNASAFLLAGTRAMAVGLAAGLAAWGAVRLATVGIRQVPRKKAAVALFLVGILAAVGLWQKKELRERLPLVDRAASTLEEGDSLLGFRRHYWPPGLRAASENPLLGVGPENYRAAYLRNFDPIAYVAGSRYGRKDLDRAHNVFLGALVESGVLGLLAYLALWGAVFSTVFGLFSGPRSDPTERALLLGFFVSVCVYLFFWFEDHSSFFLVLAAAAYARHRAAGSTLLEFESGGAPSTGRARRLLVASLLLLVGTAGLWHNGRVWAAVRHAHLAERGDDVPAAVGHYRRALDLDPWHREDLGLHLADYLSTVEVSPEDDAARAAFQEGLQVAAGALTEEIVASPRDPHLRAEYARLSYTAYRASDEDRLLDLAVEQMERAIELSPDRVRQYERLAEIRRGAGQLREAHAALDRAVEVTDRYGEVFYYRARIHMDEKDIEAAARILHRALGLGFRPPDRTFVQDVADKVARETTHADAAALYAQMFAGVYLPALADVSRLPGIELDAETRDRSPGESDDPLYNPYILAPEDLHLLGRWPVHYLKAGMEQEADLAARLLLNGTRAEGEPGFRHNRDTRLLRPFLLNFLRSLGSGDSADWMDRESVFPDFLLQVVRSRAS